MTAATDDRTVWAELVSTEQRLGRLRADFLQNAQSRAEILGQALSSAQGWDRLAALNFLRLFPDDVPALLDRLVRCALSVSWALRARQVLAEVPREEIREELRTIVSAQLDEADDEDHRRLAELLAHLEDWSALHDLVRRAMANDDPDTRQVGEDFTEWCGSMWS